MWPKKSVILIVYLGIGLCSAFPGKQKALLEIFSIFAS